MAHHLGGLEDGSRAGSGGEDSFTSREDGPHCAAVNLHRRIYGWLRLKLNGKETGFVFCFVLFLMSKREVWGKS